MGRMKRKMRKITASLTAVAIVLATVFAFLSNRVLPVNAATRIKDVEVDRLNSSVTAGYSPLELPSNVDVKVTTSKNLTKAKNGDDSYWVWQERDQGATGNIKNLGNAYVSTLNSEGTYWIKYENVGFNKENTGKKCDVKVVFDHARGEIAGAEGKDIALFDGQLGAVRFRGFKHLDCTIYIYDHGTTNLAGADAGKLHLRFIDIDCHQAVEVLSPGRVDWAYKKKAVSWAGKALCDRIGASQGNTVWFDGERDVQDNWIQNDKTTPEEMEQYKTAARHTLALGFTPSSEHQHTFKVRYYAGGTADIGTQTNGAFFSFDGKLDLASAPARLAIDKTANAYHYKVGDNVTYTISVKNTTATEVTAKNVTVTDTIPDGLQIIGANPSKGTATVNGQNITVTGADLAQNEVLTVTVQCKALETADQKELYNTASASCDNREEAQGEVKDDAEIYVNTAKVSVDKTADKYEYEVGDTVSYTVKVKNSGGIANNVTVTDTLPDGFTLDYDSVKIIGLPQTVTVPVGGTPDPTNALNPELRNETEVKTVTADKSKNGGNGWKYTINHLPAGVDVTITYNAKATTESNGKESQNVVSVSGDNFITGKDDAEVYVNTAKLAIDKKYINPYKEEKRDNRCDNEFRVYEEETGFEKVQYEVTVQSTGKEGTVAKNVVIDDLTLPEGMALNYEEIAITEKAKDGSTITFNKASGGNGKAIQYKISGTPDVTNQVNADQYNETEERTPVITVEKSGNGFIVKDTFLEQGASLIIKYSANALENDQADVNGSEVKNTAKATADNVVKKDGEREVVKDDATVYINSPRLKIVKKADSKDYEVGDNVSYTIEVINTHVGTIARNVQFTDKLETKGVQFLTGTIALYDTDGYELREGTDLAGKDDYIKKAKVDEFTLISDKHLVVDGNYPFWDLASGKTPETQGTWNPSYVGVTKETKMSIKYDMKITDKDLAGKDILNTATAVSDEALKVTTDETVKPGGPNPQVEKEIDHASPMVGKDVTFTLKFTNPNQNTIAKNIQIKDAMDKTGMVSIYADSLMVKMNNRDITDQMSVVYNETMDGFTIDTGLDLTDKDTLVVTYRAKVLENAGQTELVNTAGVNCSNNPEWKYDSVPFIPEEKKPESAIEKRADSAVYDVGDTIHYTIVVEQTTKGEKLTNVIVEDKDLPEGVIPNYDSLKVDGEAVPEEERITPNAGHIYFVRTERGFKVFYPELAGKSELTFDAEIKDKKLKGKKIPNKATIISDQTPEKEALVKVKVPKNPVEKLMEKTSNPNGVSSKGVKTGIDAHTGFYVGMAVVLLGAALVLVKKRRKGRKPVDLEKF